MYWCSSYMVDILLYDLTHLSIVVFQSYKILHGTEPILTTVHGGHIGR